MIADATAQVMLAAVPGALVHRLFLTPDHIGQVGIRRDGLHQVVFRERVELLDTHDGNIFAAFGTAFFQQVVVDLATA